MDANSAPPTRFQHGQISSRLRRYNHTEAVLLAGNLQIKSVVSCDLEEDTCVGAAFVVLTSRVKEARPKAEASGDMFRVTNFVAESLDHSFMLRKHG
jgi:hypothetical protein